jgi:hypothetical protein
MICVVAVQWLVAAALPAFVVGYLRSPSRWEAAFFCLATAYCFWTGYRAWKRGWKARTLLRLAIPIGIFVISTCIVGLIFILVRGESPG